MYVFVLLRAVVGGADFLYDTDNLEKNKKGLEADSQKEESEERRASSQFQNKVPAKRRIQGPNKRTLRCGGSCNKGRKVSMEQGGYGCCPWAG